MILNLFDHKGFPRVFSIALAVILLSSLFGRVEQPVRADYQQQEEPGKWETARIEMQARQEGQAAPLPISTNSASTINVHVVDVAIDQRTPNYSDWNSLDLKAGYDEYQRQRFLVKPLLSSLPPNAVISSASLAFSLAEWYDIPGRTRTFSLYRITTPWHPNLATWNNAPGTGELVGTMQVGTPSSLTWYTVNLTSVVQNWYQGGYPNYGLLVTGPEGGEPAYRIFGSNDAYCNNGTVTVYCGPSLTISYTVAPPSLSATSVSFLTDNDRIPLKQQQFKISNSGSTELAWTIANKPSWLSFESMSGLLGPNSSVNITATATTSGLTAGNTYRHTFQVTSTTPDVIGSPANASATLAYVQAPVPTSYLPSVSSSGAAATYPSMVAVLVGISDYWNLPDASPAAAVGVRNFLKNTDLEHAADDIHAFNSILVSADAFMNNPGSLKTVTRTDLQATKAGIMQAFQEARNLAGPGTRLLFYFSGHGLSYNSHLLMAPTEVSPDTSPIEDFISDTELDQQLDQFPAGSVVILDTCQSGAAIPYLAQNGRLILTATTATESSVESDELGQGAFSYFLDMGFMDGAADTNHDGWISFEESFNITDDRVIAYNSSQHPTMSDNITGEVNLTRP